MHQVVIDKIKELQETGINSARLILEKLKEKSVSIQQTSINRPLYALENVLLGLIVPSIIPLNQLETFRSLSNTSRELYVKNALNTIFLNSPDSEKLNVLRLSLEIQNTKNLLEKSGSKLFDDPFFGQPTEIADTQVYGDSFLESNQLEEPTLDEIRQVMSS